MIFALYLLKIGTEYSRGSVVLYSVLGLGVIFLVRRILGYTLLMVMALGGLRGRPIVTIGVFEEIERLSELERLQFGVEEVARVVLTPREQGEGLTEAAHRQLAHAIEIARIRQATEFALLIPGVTTGHARKL